MNDRELVQAPKVFAFDTGFVCHARGITELRPEDRGQLLEHLVLETLQAMEDLPRIAYWRDKSKREIDFILPFGRDRVDAIEVKWNSDAFDPRALRTFRELHPKGRNLLVSGAAVHVEQREVGGLKVISLPVEGLAAALSKTGSS